MAYNLRMWTLFALLGVYAGTSALGTGIRLGWVSTRGWRWIHHALFAIIWLALAGAVLMGHLTAAAWRWPVLAVAPFLALLPKFKPGSSAHCFTAAGGLVVLVGLIVWAIQTQ